MYKKTKKKQAKAKTVAIVEPTITKSKKKKKSKSSNASSWIQHVKSVQLKKNVSYKEALKLASQSYTK